MFYTSRVSLFCVGGGAEGDRTPDLKTASLALSQLSYGPEMVRDIDTSCGEVRAQKGLSVPPRDGATLAVVPSANQASDRPIALRSP